MQANKRPSASRCKRIQIYCGILPKAQNMGRWFAGNSIFLSNQFLLSSYCSYTKKYVTKTKQNLLYCMGSFFPKKQLLYSGALSRKICNHLLKSVCLWIMALKSSLFMCVCVCVCVLTELGGSLGSVAGWGRAPEEVQHWGEQEGHQRLPQRALHAAQKLETEESQHQHCRWPQLQIRYVCQQMFSVVFFFCFCFCFLIQIQSFELLLRGIGVGVKVSLKIIIHTHSSHPQK